MDCLSAPDSPVPHIDISVIRIRRPETIADPRVKALILRALAAIKYPGTSPDAFYDALAARISADMTGVFVGMGDDREPAAIAVAFLPETPMSGGAQVAIGYSEGDPSIARRIGDRVSEWFNRHGHDRFYCINFLHDDGIYERVFRHVGGMRRAGTIFEVML